MTTQPESRVVSLSAELAHSDDDRRQSAQRWQAALHRLCLIRATANETSFEAEWVGIFEHQLLMDDLHLRSKLLALAVLDVLEIQHEHSLMVCHSDGVAYDNALAEELPKLLVAMRVKIRELLP